MKKRGCCLTKEKSLKAVKNRPNKKKVQKKEKMHLRKKKMNVLFTRNRFSVS